LKIAGLKLQGNGLYSNTMIGTLAVDVHLVQRWRDWAEPQPVQVHPRCTKCNSLPIMGQCIPTSYYSTWHYM